MSKTLNCDIIIEEIEDILYNNILQRDSVSSTRTWVFPNGEDVLSNVPATSLPPCYWSESKCPISIDSRDKSLPILWRELFEFPKQHSSDGLQIGPSKRLLCFYFAFCLCSFLRRQSQLRLSMHTWRLTASITWSRGVRGIQNSVELSSISLPTGQVFDFYFSFVSVPFWVPRVAKEVVRPCKAPMRE